MADHEDICENKSEVAEIFFKVKAMVENQSDCKLKMQQQIGDCFQGLDARKVWNVRLSTPIAQGEKLTNNEDAEKVDETSYRSLVGCLLYLTASRDIIFAVSMLSRFIHYCNVNHYKAAKEVLRYIRGTLSHGVKFVKVENVKLLGYPDYGWARSTKDMKSTSSYFFTLGPSVFCWSLKNKKQWHSQLLKFSMLQLQQL
ncbi:secreted RxLR effector protein 161-like [Gossypium hirsutum]|uniref:Secreted RxLR effector protein 161-like n=1 Tax=Gossypium hirsutum TaxID=3635 RepID=A0A1U8L1I7_GOSHI|nr:secreted RxLR effector protein 161-like [Gossypium hirsutum]